MGTLFEIGADLQRLEQALNEADDAGHDDMVEALLTAYLESEGRLEHKLDGYACLIRELEARSEARKCEADRLRHRAQIDANKTDRLKERLKLLFQCHELKSVETPRFRLTLALNGGKLPLLISDLADLPAAYVKQVIEHKPDSDAIRGALENGIEVRGALLGERSSSIRIR